MDFFDALVRYEIGLWTAVERELARRGLVSLTTLQALRVVSRHAGRARVQEVSTDIGITVGAASKLVDRLVNAGLARRCPNPGNRRSSLITLTDAGAGALESAASAATVTIEQAIGDEDVAALTEALRRLDSLLRTPTVGVGA